MKIYKLEDFRSWLENSQTNRAGMEEWRGYFLSWYEKRPELWNETIEKGWNREVLEELLKDWKEKYGNSAEQEVKVLQNTIFVWKAEADSKVDLNELNERVSLITHGSLRHYQDYVPIVEQTEEEIELRKENSRLKFDIGQVENQNQENQEKIAKLEQENMDLKIKCRKQEEQLAKMIVIQQELGSTQELIKELEEKLKVNIQTSERSVQTELEWEKELKDKEEELRQQITKQNRLSIRTGPINPGLGDSSWMNLSKQSEEEKPLSPSQIRAREKQRQQEQVAQVQTNLPLKKI